MMRLLVICNEIPLPANHGGRVDALRRIRALSAVGVGLPLLVTWCSQGDAMKPEPLIAGLAANVEAVQLFEISRSWPARISRIWQLLCGRSLYVVTRNSSRDAVAALVAQARDAGVDAILLEGLFGGALAMELAQRLEVPYFYRSQNVEFLYLRKQRTVAHHWRQKLVHQLACNGLENFERKVIAGAALTFDISVDDMHYWQGQGIGQIRWLPPLCEPLPAVANVLPAVDVAFLGNLFMPNNVQGVCWLIDEVWPLVRARRPQASLRISGSKPVPAIVDACARGAGVELLANVAVVSDVYAAAQVLVNPVLVGSGVNMKALELLDTGKPVISTPAGVQGLPAEHQSLFELASAPAAFAEAILSALKRQTTSDATSLLPDCYRPEGIRPIVAMMQSELAREKRLPS